MMPDQDRFKSDNELANLMKTYPVVLPALGYTESKNDPISSKVQVVGKDPENKLVQYPGMINSVNSITRTAAGVGIVNTFPEIDGVVRRMPLLISANSTVQPSLAIEALRAMKKDRIQAKIGDTGVEAIRIPSLGKFSTDSLSRIWIDWSVRTHEHSLTNLPKSFEGGIVVVGLTAPGLANPVPTSKGEVFPHHVQAAVMGTIIDNNTIIRPDWAEGAEIIGLLIAGLLIIFMTRWVYVGIGFYIILSGCIVGLSIVGYSKYRMLIDATIPVFGILVVALHAYSVKFISEFLQKQQIRKQFQSYLSPDLVAKLIKDPSLLKLGGEEKELSIMFTDVRGFTSISEHYGKDVQGLTKIMNRYMTAMTRNILENNGTLDKYIGDAQMAFWNAPLDETKHCKESVQSALSMMESLKEFNDEIGKEGVPPFGMGIGINTGTVVVGNMGSDQRFDYTCLGDAVNLASRLEGQSKNYGVNIIIGPITASRLEGMFFEIELDSIAVKGKNDGVVIYTVFENPQDIKQWQQSREIHNLMLDYYRKQKWDRCIELINTTLKGEFNGNLDKYYQLWLERIEDLRLQNLPETWDGVWRAQSK
jgi:adenylate cyclase